MQIRDLGSILLIAGTAIGAGMLALPMAAATGGFFPALILMGAICLLMLYTSLMFLEVNLLLPPDKNSFISMAEIFLGKIGKFFTWGCYALLLYAITAAYISGMGSLLSELLTRYGFAISSPVCAILFTIVLGSTLLISTAMVDRANQVFLYLKALFLFTALVSLLPFVKSHTLFSYTLHTNFWFQAIPIFTTAFSSSILIPSITNYIGKEHPQRIRKVIWVGSFIPLFVYTFWLFVIFGVLPQTGEASFAALAIQHNDLGIMIQYLRETIQIPWIVAFIDAFSNTAMTTSFLGVSLGLFDCLADGFSISKTGFGRLKLFLLTLAPPLGFALFYPEGFLLALRYAALFVSILLILLPAVLHFYKRRKHLSSGYHLPSSPVIQLTIILIGIFCIYCSLR